MNKDNQEKTTKRKFGCLKIILIIIGGAIVIGIIGSIFSDQEPSKSSEDFSQPDTSIQDQQPEQIAPSLELEPELELKLKSEPEPEPELEPILTSEPKTDRDKMIEILKENALVEWGSDYEMVKYEYDNQIEAYDWVVKQTKYPAIIEKAKQEWGNDYKMVKYEYENQVEAYEWINQQTTYPDIMDRAKGEWGDDYEMVKYEYENQVEAYESL